MDHGSNGCVRKTTSVNLDKLIHDFSQIEKKMIETTGKNNILDMQLEKTNCLLKGMQTKEVSLKEECATLHNMIKGLQQTIEYQHNLKAHRSSSQLSENTRGLEVTRVSSRSLSPAPETGESAAQSGKPGSSSTPSRVLPAADLDSDKGENEQLKRSADLMKEKLKSHEQEYKNNIAKLMSEMKIKEEVHKVEIKKLYQDMQKKVELSEEKNKELIEKMEVEVSELNEKLRIQEKEKQSEIIKLQLEFDAKLARVQTKSKPYPDSTVLPQSIYRRKLQHLQEEKNKEIAILRNTIQDLEQRLSVGKDPHLKRRRF